MRAVLFERTGPAADVLHLVDIATPEPGAGEVRVRVHASGVNPVDVKTRGGARTTQLAFPHITPHSDGAGVIDAIGTGVPSARLGERVWLYNACWGRPQGTAAEFVVLPSAQAVPLPENTSFAAGACFGIPALTAWQAVNVDGGVTSKTVLVAGGAGAVGHYAIQFARAAGAARILSSVSGPEKAAIALAAEQWRAQGGLLKIVTLPLAVANGEAWARYGVQADGAAYLVRPDQHVCARWRAPTAADVAAALKRALALH
jgi:NADPH2:quinone reductase